jgi:DNA topoisomerase-2
MLFDSKGKIKKYHDPLDIIKEFYNVRLEYYNKRKVYLLALYKRQYDIAESRVRFIMAIIDKRLTVFQKSKLEIETQLISMIFPKMDLQGGNNVSYKYLLDMAIHNFSQEKINELLKQQKEKKLKLDSLQEMELEDIWIDDLNDFIKLGLV